MRTQWKAYSRKKGPLLDPLEEKNILGKATMTKQYCSLRQEVQVRGIKNLLLATLQRSFMTVTKGRVGFLSAQCGLFLITPHMLFAAFSFIFSVLLI